ASAISAQVSPSPRAAKSRPTSMLSTSARAAGTNDSADNRSLPVNCVDRHSAYCARSTADGGALGCCHGRGGNCSAPSSRIEGRTRSCWCSMPHILLASTQCCQHDVDGAAMLTKLSEATRASSGGKATALGALLRVGLPVPDG